MKHPLWRLMLALCVAGVITTLPAHALLVTYTGANGLAAEADFVLLNAGSTLQITLTNTSVSPFGGGGANMVLSSLNFDLAGVNITGGSVALNTGSLVVTSDDPPNNSVWADAGFAGDLDDEYGFSNTGIGNAGTGVVVGALSALTSHSNGGNAVTTFNGDSGLPGGLDYGLVAAGSSAFGNNNYILDSVVFTLDLSVALVDLSFLDDGTYVEFGSDFAYVPGIPEDEDNPVVPEPASIALVGLGLLMAGQMRRRHAAGSIQV